ncbi:MAG TPA: DUF3450 family protein [Opitutaceae bacterium]|nr:DUF3450 family protein [Opitutaceae bacterium]
MNNLLKKCIVLVVAAAVATTSLAQSASQSNFDLARATLENWVETRQLISKETADWEVERQALTDSVELLTKEIATLDENIEKAEGDTTAADTEREKLLADNEALKGAAATVGGLVGAIEQRVLKILAALPEDLKGRENIQLLERRIPKNAQATRLSLSERMQTIVVLLTEVEKFNSSLNIAVETRKVPSGEMAQVTTFYLGLAQGFYVDATRQFAGVLTPGPDGWVATDRNDLAPLVGDVLDLYNKQKQPPQFVKIPVEIK